MHVILLTGLWEIFPSRTLGPYLLRHRLEKFGHKTQVIDYCQEWTAEEIMQFIDNFIDEQTVCLGISTTFWQDTDQRFWVDDGGMPPNIFKVTEIIKKKYPQVKIVLGGAGVRYICKNLRNVDALVVGESEDLFPQLISHYRFKTAEPEYFIHSKNKLKYYNKPVNKTYSVETCDFKFEMHDAILPGETLPMETARGCIFKCKFCAFPHLGKKKFDYIKPLDIIRQQFIENYERWGTTSYSMMDDTFNDSEYKIDSFLKMVKTLPFDLKYTGYIRADLVHNFKGQDLKLLDSGLEGTNFGIESLHPYASQAVGKGWSGRHAKEYLPELIHNIWRDQVNVQIGMIIGLPREREDSLRESLKWINDNDIHAVWSVLQLQTPSSLSGGELDSVSFLSEFDRNYSEYGYKFGVPGHKNWYLEEGWSWADCTRLQAELYEGRKIARLNPWIAQSIKVIGYSMQELINNPMRGKYFMLMPEVVRRKKKFLTDYQKLLLSIKR